ncbi:hypothetical protein FGK63_02780 [Ruegeria sediminis]|uniref:DUF2946 domain-containing protein n=1 Tax=Ruegeria sediminis TaxID=2583820 RepID=A0ABY2X4M5_9RHOB|nr:hypothetical protein [Ruegeria sediminis]TMV10005.1 hypothetical protein FGK63_02780 [Ruegeria sediminis]
MTGKTGNVFGCWLLAVGLFIAGFLLAPEPAFAHGGDGAVHAPLDPDTPDPDHVEKGHPGHCHGGSFCNGVAMVVAGPTAPEPFSAVDTHAIPKGQFRVLAVSTFDPPPPRALS